MHWGLFQDATVTTTLQVATLMQQCMRQQVKLVVVCVMVACTTQWAETVNSVNHSSIKTQTEK
jgi:type III secretory pathway component EscS